ncbi:MAG: NADH-quinone oxidoreductase subunit C [Alphaproteobacteria bacterium]
MDADGIHRALRAKHGNAIEPDWTAGDWPVVSIEPTSVAEVCRMLRDDPALAFDCLSNLSGVDRKADDRIEVWYHLYSYRHRHQVALRTTTPRHDPVLPTVSHLWPIANWLERECWDLLGVRFLEHPDLRRLLMPEDWVGHPLRKDFVEPDEYHGISTRRESLLKL